MAYTTVISDNELIKWNSNYWTEYVQETGFQPFMSASPNAIFQTHRELIDGGKDLIIQLIGSLKGSGTGAGLLTGSEEKLDQFSFRVRPAWRRNAVVVKRNEKQKSVIDIMNAQKDVLKLWSSDDLRERVAAALTVVAEDDTRYDEDNGLERQVPYAEATSTQRNAWLTNNVNRALFGITEANLVSGNMASSLANVDTTADLWSAAVIDAAKVMAERRNRATGVRAIRPNKLKDGNGWFVLFVPQRAMTQLRKDTDIKEFNKLALKEMDANPYFQGGDLLWNGVIIKQIPELGILTGVGASSADVAPGYLCGAQAVTVAWGQDPRSTRRKDDDYDFITGIGTEELRAVSKTFFNNTQHGIVSVFAAVA